MVAGGEHLEGPEASQDPEEGGLAAAIRAHDHDGLPMRHSEAQLAYQSSAIWRVQRHPVCMHWG